MYYEAYGKAAAKKGRELLPFEVARNNVSLVLGNSFKPLSPAIRLPANYKEIGGYHIKSHDAILPEVR